MLKITDDEYVALEAAVSPQVKQVLLLEWVLLELRKLNKALSPYEEAPASRLAEIAKAIAESHAPPPPPPPTEGLGEPSLSILRELKLGMNTRPGLTRILEVHSNSVGLALIHLERRGLIKKAGLEGKHWMLTEIGEQCTV